MPILGGKNKFNSKPPVIRVEKVAAPAPKPRPKLPHATSSNASSARNSPRASPNPAAGVNGSSNRSKSVSSSSRKKSASPYPTSSSDERRAAKRKAASAGPSQPKFDNDSDSDGDDDDDFVRKLEVRKRQRLSDGQLVDTKRILTRASAFKEGLRDLSRLIHAADITNVKSCPKAKRVLGATEQDDIRVRLQYPSMYGAEK